MVRFGRYAAASAVGATGVVFHAFNSRQQFYPAMLYLSTSKLSLVLLLNMALVMICTLWKVTKNVFLGRLREIEVERLNEQLWREVTEVLFAMTVFRNEFNLAFVTQIIILLFVKALHWLAQTRVEYIETTPSVSRLSHARIMSFMTLLLTLDSLLFTQSFNHLLRTKEASVSLLFAFEYVILATATMATMVKYCLYLGDVVMDGQWDNKATYVFYLELVRDLIHLSLYLCFFFVIFRFKGLPLHLVRELYETFRSFKTRVADFIRYRNVTSNMNDRFPDGTPEELTRIDATCIICREEMSAAKKLPCGHLFHIHCLRSWLESHSTCPTCRTSVLAPEGGARPPTGPAAAVGADGQRGADAGSNSERSGQSSSGQAPPDARTQQERLQVAASSAAAQYQSSYVYPTTAPDGTFRHPAFVAFIPQAYLAAMLRGGQNAATPTSANSGSEQGSQGTGKGSMSEPTPSILQAQLWQAWAQMSMAAIPATYAQWPTAAGAIPVPSSAVNGQPPPQGAQMPMPATFAQMPIPATFAQWPTPSWAVNGQTPVQGQSTSSSTAGESSQSEQQHKDVPKQTTQEVSVAKE